MDAATLILSVSLRPRMKFDTNWGPQSLITSSGSPCNFQMPSRNSRATPSEVTSDVVHPYRVKIPSTILARSSHSHIKLIDRLSDPPPSLIDQLSPAGLRAPLSEPAGSSSPPALPTGQCFICVHIHGLPNCVPTFCKKTNHSRPDPKK